MKNKLDHEKGAFSGLELNAVAQREKALEVLAIAKKQEAKKIAAGKKWYRVDHKTEILI